ncbi:MAG: S41 family peptidase [Bacteroidia bacterium]|nr:S41 family peptidase [Bacteroidia bacterium]
MKKLIFISIILFICCQVRAQSVQNDSLMCFDFAVKLVETNYAGYSIKVNDETVSQYSVMKDSLRTLVAGGESSMRNAVGCYLAWFRDYHMTDAYGIAEGYIGGPIEYASFMDYHPQNVSCQVSEDTYLIRLATCSYSARKWVKQAARAFNKSKCTYLIVDLRGNTGGQNGQADPLIEMLYDKDWFHPGAEIRRSEDNISYFRNAELIKSDKGWQERIDRVEASTEEYFPLTEGYLIHFKRRGRLPVSAAVIIDNLTASNAEGLVLSLKNVSDRVTVYGRDNSLGCYDLCDPQWYSLTGYNFRFRIPTTRTTGLPENGIDANGLEPDVRIPLDYPKVLTDNIDEWVIWIKDNLPR